MFFCKREFTEPITASSMWCPNLSPTKLSRIKLVQTKLSHEPDILHAVAFESAGMLDNLVVGKKGSFSGKLLLAGAATV